jgi:hypothetical protein
MQLTTNYTIYISYHKTCKIFNYACDGATPTSRIKLSSSRFVAREPNKESHIGNSNWSIDASMDRICSYAYSEKSFELRLSFQLCSNSPVGGLGDNWMALL